MLTDRLCGFQELADGKQTKKIIEDNGLKCPSCHFSYGYGLQHRRCTRHSIDWAHAVGPDADGTATFRARSLGACHRRPRKLSAGRRIPTKLPRPRRKPASQQFLHNEGTRELEARRWPAHLPVAARLFGPDLVKMQFQMSSMRTIGNPINVLQALSGPLYLGARARRRSRGAHAAGAREPNADQAGRAPRRPRRRGPRSGAPGIPMGEDSVDWPAVFTAMKQGGVKNYFIEQEQAQRLGLHGEGRGVPEDSDGRLGRIGL